MKIPIFYCYLRLLVTTSGDQTARVWKTSDFSLVQELKHDYQRWVWDAAFSADSQYVFTGKYQLRTHSINNEIINIVPLAPFGA